MGRSLPIAMSLLGIPIEIHDAHYNQFTPDDVWLPDIGAKGWVVLTQDSRFRFNQNEMQALVSNSVACFVFAIDGLNRWQKLRVIAKVWDEIERITATELPPYIYSVTKSGSMRRLHPPESPKPSN